MIRPIKPTRETYSKFEHYFDACIKYATDIEEYINYLEEQNKKLKSKYETSNDMFHLAESLVNEFKKRNKKLEAKIKKACEYLERYSNQQHIDYSYKEGYVTAYYKPIISKENWEKILDDEMD